MKSLDLKHVARQIIVVVFVVVAIAIAFDAVIDLLPSQVRLRVAPESASQEELGAAIEDIFERRPKIPEDKITATLDACVLTVEASHEAFCDSGGYSRSRTFYVDISELQTLPARVRTSINAARAKTAFTGPRPERGFINWSFNKQVTLRNQRFYDANTKIFADARNRYGRSQKADQEAITVFIERYGEVMRSNYREFRNCSRGKSMQPFGRNFSASVAPDDTTRLVKLVHAYKRQFCESTSN